MICLISCKYNTSMIALPMGCGVMPGELVACPDNCPGKCSACPTSGMFVPAGVWRGKKEIAPDSHPVRYSQRQRMSVWGQTSMGQAPVRLAFGLNGASPEMQLWYTSEKQLNKLKELRSCEGGGAQGSAEKEFLCPKDQKVTRNRICIGGNVFSDDPAVQRAMKARPLQGAIRDVFRFWRVDAVFDYDGTLRDDFVWLLTKISPKPIEKKVVDSIVLRDTYTESQKFFNLFYKVAFADNPPSKFYWCSQRSSRYPVPPLFDDKKDFFEKYLDKGETGAWFRDFYKHHKEEVLFYLGMKDERDFFDEMMFFLILKENRIYLLDDNGAEAPVCLGSLTDLIMDMQTYGDLQRMRQILSFLETYSISCEGIAVRKEPLGYAVGGGAETPAVYGAVSSNCKDKMSYEIYLTLLREYIARFAPPIVAVGDLTFTREKFSDEAEAICKEYFNAFFDGTDPSALQEWEGKARLTKSLYERGVMNGFSVKDPTRLRRILNLVVDMDVDDYLSIYPNPTLRVNGREMSLKEYILFKVDVPTRQLSANLSKSKVITAILSKKVKLNVRNLLSELSKEYDREYSDEFR